MGNQKTKSLVEAKSIQGLKVLGNDKAAFKEWNEKLISAVCSTAGKECREFLDNLGKEMDMKRAVIEDLQLVEGYQKLEDFEQTQ